ncbi:hypothetical protein DFP72DRAFT_886366, partial [Ephemerocybe angulata]
MDNISSPIQSSPKMTNDKDQLSLEQLSSSPGAIPPPSTQPHPNHASSGACIHEKGPKTEDAVRLNDDQTGGARSSSTMPQRISDLAETPFAPFDSSEEIGRPFHENISVDNDFQRELTSRLASVIFETHAWMASRPGFERENHLNRLTDDMERIQLVEQEQAVARKKLVICAPFYDCDSSISSRVPTPAL